MWILKRQWELIIDSIPTKFIRASRHCMALPSSFTDCWKAAIVTPVMKSQNNISLSNFRPISVLPVLSKILKQVVSDQIVAHFCKYNLFSEKQSGFHHGYSTQDVLLHVTDSFLSAIDSGQCVGAVFLDLAKAFDCVDHSILLQKLSYYGINGNVTNVLSWLASFLCNKTQQVTFQGSLSSRGYIKVGVPQGSILGPLLFSIYVNDLPRVISQLDINMFADDTELHFSHSNLSIMEQTLQTDIWNVSTWLVVNKLKLNVVKSLCMLIGSHQRISGKCLNLVLDGAALKQTCTTKYLGVYFDQHLTWDTHVNYVLKSVRG